MISLFNRYIFVMHFSLIIGAIPIVAMQQPKSIQITSHKASNLPLDTASITAADLLKLQPTFDTIKSRMDDWPQLNYYRHDNERIKQGKSPDVVFLGDSIFEYWKDPQLSNLFSNKSYINRGIAAQTTPQILLRLRSDVIALKPKAMILLAGVNDIGANTGPITLEETEGNITSIAELATIARIKVILCSVLPVSDYHFDGKDPRGSQMVKRPLEKINALNTWIKQYAYDHHHLYIDYYSALIDKNGKLACELSNDDLHPNSVGYAIMASLTEEAIKKTLK